MPRKALPLSERLQNYTVDPATDCWVWAGSLHSTGYPFLMLKENGKAKGLNPRRLHYEAVHGPIPVGAEVERCRTTFTCVNPEHGTLRLLGQPRLARYEVPTTEKRCTGCDEVKSLDDFAADGRKRDGHQSRCRPCQAAEGRARSAQRRAAQGLAPLRKLPPRHERDAAWWKEYHLATYLKSRYGITIDEFQAMQEAQEGVCAICREVCIQKARLSVDHSHTTGKVRGLLCGRCNMGLGLAKDEADLLDAMASYLEATA